MNALNSRLLDDYIKDAGAGIGRWNKAIARSGIDFEIKLPCKGFNRSIGEFAGHYVTPGGEVVTESEWRSRRDEWLTSDADGEYILSLMKACVAPGEYAGWIAEPRMGIDKKPGDFEYVRIES